MKYVNMRETTSYHLLFSVVMVVVVAVAVVIVVVLVALAVY